MRNTGYQTGAARGMSFLILLAILGGAYYVITQKPELLEGVIGKTALTSGETTGLSTKAQGLKIDMTRTQVLRVLGKPKWAAIPGDRGPMSLKDKSFGLELRWENPGCRDITVLFAADTMKTVAWDDGSERCDYKEDLPNKEAFSCELADRKQYCTMR